jgi:hypothetical protein
MSTGKRPGGLTALAVLNFVFGGFGCLGLIAMFALLQAADSMTDGASSTALASSGELMVTLLLATATVILLIVAGIGYLGQKKTLGYLMGNLYAIVSIVSSAVPIVAYSQSVGVGSLIGFIYPVLTLILINTTFKQDLVN